MRAPMTPAREVRKLKAEVKRLRRALAPFAKFDWPNELARVSDNCQVYTTCMHPGEPPTSITMGDLRRARAAMKEGP